MDAFEPVARWQPGWTGCGGEVPSFGISWTLTRHLLSPISLMLRRYLPAFWIIYSLRNWHFSGHAEAALDCIFLASSCRNFASSGFFRRQFLCRYPNTETVYALLFVSPAMWRRLSFLKSPIDSPILFLTSREGLFSRDCRFLRHTGSSGHSMKVCTDIPASWLLTANGRMNWENILLRPQRSSWPVWGLFVSVVLKPGCRFASDNNGHN